MEELKKYLAELRKDFSLKSLDEAQVSNNPTEQFSLWMKEAVDAQVNEPNAMVISTVSATCKPSSRIVLLRGFGENGFVFYTNYNSQKGHDISRNPYVSLNFFWPELERQVRIDGQITKLSEEDSDAYFNSRPRESKIGAWTSPQSRKIQSRGDLERMYGEMAIKFEGKEVPRPEHWGGYSVKPELVEFWQGRISRLHDRICYTLLSGNTWKIERLAP